MKLHIVPARTGLLWVKLGIQTFFKQPLAMMGLFFLLMTVFSLTALLPVLGSALSVVLVPAGTLGLMAASRQANQGKFPMPWVLLSALKTDGQGRKNMLMLGAFYAAGLAGLMGVSALFDNGQFARLYLLGGKLTEELIVRSDFQRAAWAVLILYLPLSLLFWHAPALVHWHKVTPLKSLFFSLIACCKNWRALLVFGLVWIGVFISATVLLGFAPFLAIPGFMLIATLFFTSLFFTFRDSFEMTPA